MAGTAKVLGSSLTSTCFLFQTGNILFQKKIAGQLFVCLSVVGLVLTSGNCFFYAHFLGQVLNNPRPKLFRPIFASA